MSLWQEDDSVAELSLSDTALDPTQDVQATAGRCTISVPPAVTSALLGQSPAGSLDDALLAGLLIGLGRSFPKGERVRILLESHGRVEKVVPGADLSRTMGWFTSAYPVTFPVPHGTDPHHAVAAVTQQLRRYPDNGVGYGLLRYLNPETTDTLAHLPVPQIAFNNLGRLGGDLTELTGTPWLPAAEEYSSEAALDPQLPLVAPLTLDANVVEGPEGPAVRVRVGFASRILNRETVTRLLDAWLQALAEISQARTVGSGRSDAVDNGLPLAAEELGSVSVTAADSAEFTARYGAVAAVLPTAPLQAGLLFHAEYADGGTDVYTAQTVLTLTGKLDARRLRDGAQEVLRRYPNLRAAFVNTASGDLVQVIPAETTLRWEYLSAGDPAEFAEIQARQRREPFDPAQPPLVRFALVETGESEWRLLVSVHHLLLDGWSLPLFLRELIAAYAVNGQFEQLEPPADYGRYLRWLAERDTAAEMRRWREALADFPEPSLLSETTANAEIAIPVDIPLDLPPDLTAKLLAVTSAYSVTLATVVQFAWAVVLGR
ncbi:MAG: non-ribosomal peptide synthetase, partial [Mycobacterium sp.]|nr:non-ribosomal peptide synthetase [Mycobacterium sp.]